MTSNRLAKLLISIIIVSIVGKLFFSDFLISKSIYPSFVFLSATTILFGFILSQAKYRNLARSLIRNLSIPVLEESSKIYRNYFLNILFFTLWSIYILTKRQNYLFVHYDGRYLLQMAMNALSQNDWKHFFSSGILQGLGMGIEYPINAHLDFGLFGANLITSSLSLVDYRVICYLIWGVLIFSSTYVLARTLNLKMSYCAISSWLSVLLTLYPTPLAISGVFGHVPSIATIIFLNNLVTATVLQMPYLKQLSSFIFSSVSVFLLVAYGLYVNPLWMIITFPWLLVIVMIQLIGHLRSKRHFCVNMSTYLAALLPSIFFVVVSLSSLTLYSNTVLFRSYMETRVLRPSQATYFLEGDLLYKVILCVTLIFVYWFAKEAKISSIQVFFYSLLFASCSLVLIGTLIVALKMNWPGPQPSYFEIAIFPFFGIVIAMVLNLVDDEISRKK